jgi:hypothetical protein
MDPTVAREGFHDMQAKAQENSKAMPVPREAFFCAVSNRKDKLEEEAPCRAPLPHRGPVAKLENAAAYQAATRYLASGFESRLAYFTEGPVLVNQPDLGSGNVSRVCGFEPHALRFHDPITGSYGAE